MKPNADYNEIELNIENCRKPIVASSVTKHTENLKNGREMWKYDTKYIKNSY